MTIDERMSRCKANLIHSMERLDRAFGQIDAAYRGLASESRKFADVTQSLGGVVGQIHANLQRYDGELTTVHAGVRELGGNSRRLASIMDEYLTGTAPRRAAVHAA